MLAAIMAASQRPATEVLGLLSGTTLDLKVLTSGGRTLTGEEQHRLTAPAGTPCRHRTALLVTADGTVAAGTWLLWLPSRLPLGACTALDDGTEPAGRILAPLGMHRADRRALATTGIEEITGADAAVRSSAVLVAGGVPVAIAEENILAEFAEAIGREGSSP